MSDLATTAQRLQEAITDLDRACDTCLTLDQTATILAVIEDLRAQLTVVRDGLSDRAGDLMGSYRQPVTGVGTLERHSRKKRTAWQTDDLLRAVLDSRTFDKDTGELRDETPLDKVRAVWNLGAPRTGALKERHIDPDDYCSTEGSRGGYSIRIHRDSTGDTPTISDQETP